MRYFPNYRLKSAAVALIFLTCLLFSPRQTIHAASIAVASSCSLADAITAANSDTATGGCIAGSGADTITLSAAITLSARLPNITSDITIAGASHSISGADSYRIFYVTSNGNLTVNSLTLKDGNTNNEGGAIYNHGTLKSTTALSAITSRQNVVARFPTRED